MRSRARPVPCGPVRSGPRKMIKPAVRKRRFTGFWCARESCIKRDLVARTPALYEHITKIKNLKATVANVYPNNKSTQIRNDACPRRVRCGITDVSSVDGGRGAEWEQ